MLAGWLAPGDEAVVEATLDKLWLHKVGGYATRRATHATVAHWRDPVDTDAALRWLSTRAELRLVLPVRAASEACDVSDAWARAETLGILEEPPPPLLRGRDLKQLGIPPGPHMGRLLQAVYARQLDGALTDEGQAREAALAEYDSAG
jgi:hypothetical protein